jgi:hypothetical protein
MNESSANKQNPIGFTQLDLLGWIGYVIGCFLSIWGKHQTGALLAATGLILVIVFYAQKAANDLLGLAYESGEYLNIVLAIAFFILLFLKFKGIAAICLGAIFFLHGCLSLKGQKIYVGSQWRFEDRKCYTRNANPGYYWMSTLFLLVLGFVLLIIPVLLKRWDAY